MIQYLKSISNEKIFALALAALLLFSAGAALFPALSANSTFQYDEFYSLERSNGFDKFGDWLTVYSGNQPSFKKPPLQYWLNAINLELGMPITLSIRLWSYLFMLALLAVSAFTCYYLCGENAWSIPAGILFF